eukprot:TRINITY_DN9241_c0_g1_i1.p1 TRINITY_DN9241_c0_g1~~TRINITY_DN9241_c0_g1_i1.p1  ORF type:complete len:220 (+),score=25.12 TRINITY_DN9241_c0_g1_i1:339-998(+)
MMASDEERIPLLVADGANEPTTSSGQQKRRTVVAVATSIGLVVVGLVCVYAVVLSGAGTGAGAEDGDRRALSQTSRIVHHPTWQGPFYIHYTVPANRYSITEIYVENFLVAGQSKATSIPVTVRIFATNPTTKLPERELMTVPFPYLWGPFKQDLLHLVLPKPIPIEPMQTYVIEVQSHDPLINLGKAYMPKAWMVLDRDTGRYRMVSCRSNFLRFQCT